MLQAKSAAGRLHNTTLVSWFRILLRCRVVSLKSCLDLHASNPVAGGCAQSPSLQSIASCCIALPRSRRAGAHARVRDAASSIAHHVKQRRIRTVCRAKRREANKVCTILSLAWTEASALTRCASSLFVTCDTLLRFRPCPKCNILIERAEACPHMVCPVCTTHFSMLDD